MSIAMVMGPFLGLTILDHFTDAVLFIVCLSFAILSLICGIIAKVPKCTAKKKKFKTWHWKRLIEIRAIPISVAGSIIAFAYGGITTFITSYAKEMGMSQIASYFFVVFAVMIVISRPFTGKIFDRLGEHLLIYPGIGLFTLGMLALSQVFSPVLVLVAAGVLGLGYGAVIPSFQAIAIKASPKNRRGLAVGTYFLLFDSGFGLGAYFLGLVASKTNYHTMYLIAGIISVFTGLIYYSLYHRKSLISKVSNEITVS
jgi:MFS family permease